MGASGSQKVEASPIQREEDNPCSLIELDLQSTPLGLAGAGAEADRGGQMLHRTMADSSQDWRLEGFLCSLLHQSNY